MDVTYTNQVRIANMHNEYVAEFLIGESYIQGMVTYAGFKLYESEPSNPVVFYGGPWLITREGFLGYLGNICSKPEKYPYRLEGPKGACNLTKNMSAVELARILGYTVEDVKAILNFHLTFTEAQNENVS